jgi:uncharacterized membrane protein YkvA (DUF1232 family)
MELLDNNKEMSKNFSEKSFFRKVKRFALRVGKAGIGLALTLFYTAMDSDTPKWAKTIILASLGYLILPIDAIPDIIPGLGFSDDLSALLAAFSSIAVHIKEEHKLKAKEKLAKYFKE